MRVPLFGKTVVTCIFGFMLIFFGRCARQERDTERIAVAVSIPPQAEFAERIGGKRVRVLIMVPPGANPHTYEPTPHQLVELSEAALYVKVGTGIEFELAWLDRIIAMNQEMLVVDASVGIEPGATGSTGAEHGTGAATGEDHDSGTTGAAHPHAHGELDPHVWVSPRNAMIMVDNTCRGLVSVDPEHRDEYMRNRDAYRKELNSLDRSIGRSFAGKSNRTFIAYHPAWGYLARDYGLVQITIEEEGKEPTARGIARLVDRAKRDEIRVIFVLPQFNTKSAEVIAAEIGGTIVRVDPLARHYIENIRRVAAALCEAME